jgi:hypothetical protein
MISEIWNIKAEIIANFFLVNEDRILCQTPPHPAIRYLKIVPELNEQNQQTGKFFIEINYEASTTEELMPAEIPAELGRDIFQYYINLLTFLSGNPIKIVSPPSLTYNYPGTRNTRLISFGTEIGFFEPPVPILNTTLFTNKIDSKISRVLAWLKKGLEESDIVNSVLSLFISLEILSNQYDCPQKIIKKCTKCGYQMKLEPGMKQKVENFLVQNLGYKTDKFAKIWDLRNKLSHGGFDLSVNDVHEMYNIKQDLSLAIIKGTKKLLNFTAEEPPREIPPPWGFSESLLDIVYTDNQ